MEKEKPMFPYGFPPMYPPMYPQGPMPSSDAWQKGMEFAMRLEARRKREEDKKKDKDKDKKWKLPMFTFWEMAAILCITGLPVGLIQLTIWNNLAHMIQH